MPEPMTTAELDQLRAYWDGSYTQGGRHVRRLLAEVNRLRARTEELAKEAQFQGRRADEARAENRVLKLEPSNARWAELVTEKNQLIEEAEGLRTALAEAHRQASAEETRAAALEAVYRQTRRERDARSAEVERLRVENTALAAQEHDPLYWFRVANDMERHALKAREERDALAAKLAAVQAIPAEPRCDHSGDCSDWSHGWESGRNATLREVGRVLDGLPPLRDYSEAPRPPAEGAVEPPASPDGDTDRGTGEPTAQNSIQASEWPDIDGWTLTATPRGVMVSHSTDMRVLVADQGDPMPVGAVLAFIADQEGHADER